MNGFVSKQRASSLLLQKNLVSDKSDESDARAVEVAILGAHKDEVAALSARESVSLAHHQRHVVELINFKGVKNKVHKVLIHIVHLNDEVGLIDCFILRVFAHLVENAFFFKFAELLAHVI